MKEKVPEKDYYYRILGSVVSFLRSSGLSCADIKEAISDVLEREETKGKQKRTSSSLGGNADTVFALVLHRWYREPGLLDEEAQPRPIKLLGRYPSVEALISAENPEVTSKKLVSAMLGSGLIRKVKAGQYLPASRIATVSSLHPMLVEHVTNSLVRYLETVRQNTSSKRSSPTLIERYTHVPDLDVSDIEEFRDFAQLHGTGFLASVDDWLEKRRTKNKKSKGVAKGVSAGIHVFAYVEGPPSAPKATRRAKRA